MSAAANGRGHLSIGEVLSLLQEEFPDVTISKIRFLESQGLLDPERTPSGYRKFYEDDIERLRWILRLQKDHYLPLKVIKDRLDELSSSPSGGAPLNGASSGPRLVDVAREGEKGSPAARAARDGHPVGDRDNRDSRDNRTVRQVRGNPPARTAGGARSRRANQPSSPGPGERPPAPTPLRDPTPLLNGTSSSGAALTGPAGSAGGAGQTSPGHHGPGAGGFEPGADAVSLTVEELAEASGLSLRDVRELERFGLVEPRPGTTTYDGDALIVARTAAGFLQHGIEARHMRTYKVAADREAGLFQQIVSPVLKQRNPEARTRATRTVTELIRLGEVMRGVLLRRELREHTGGG
jgi:DNA-binding transcriptional MerR regulator